MTPAQLTLVKPDDAMPERIRAGQRDRYLDLLRMLALIQMMVVNVVSFVWYPATFPAVGIVFAIGGSMIAGSLDRSPHRPLPVVKKRVLQLLAPLWAMGAILVPLMIASGWTNTDDAQPLEATALLKWILPISPPPASDLGYQLAQPFWMWALSCYLWLLVMSPALLWLFRRWPKRTLALPLALLLLNVTGLAPLTADGDVVLRVATFGACWLLGFAHHDGLLTRIRLLVALAVSATLCGIGVAFAYVLPTFDRGPVPDETPLAYGFLSIGLVLILLRLHPHVRGRLGTHRFLTNLVTAVDHRAMTIYLWGHACISLSNYLIQLASAQPRWPAIHEQAWPVMTLALSAVLLLICAVCLGWVEDKAAGGPARIRPWPKRAEATAAHEGRHRTGRWRPRSHPRRIERLPSP